MVSSFIIVLIILGGGFLIGYLARKLIVARSVDSAEAKAEKIIEAAKTREKEILLDAKDKTLTLISEAKKEEEARRKEDAKTKKCVLEQQMRRQQKEQGRSVKPFPKEKC